MRAGISPISFILGLVVAGAVPLVARTFRPLGVQAIATALDAFEEAQRILSEQKERWEDIVAEAKVQRAAAREAPSRRRRGRRTDPQPPATSGTSADGSVGRSA
jgi:hypothetical protein